MRRHLLIPLIALLSAAALNAQTLDLTHAIVVVPPAWTGPSQKAVSMLVEEVEKRTQIRWRVQSNAGPGVSILLAIANGGPAEGYRVEAASGAVHVTGNDARGLLFGVGYLLRKLHMKRGGIALEPSDVTTAPRYRLRGHQLGYRPKTNSYDGWTVPMWEQYIRDLAVFGTNAIELIPPRSDDAPDSPHFPLPQMPMMIEMSRIANEYGLDVWVWYPAMDKDYADPKTVEFAIREWGEVLRQLPRVDAVFVPGGDPGHTQPKYLMALLEKQIANLHRYHPKAQMWVSPQSFDRAWLDEFYAILKTEPAWLTGVVYGPQVRVSLEQMRAAVPKRYPIRNYPDITHSSHAQFPVPDWDVALAMTAGREPINPRPHDMKAIFQHERPDTIGALSYSEGCNDDVNKIVWSALGWNPGADVAEVLRDYGRYFISDRFAVPFADMLLRLEENWRGPLAANSGVYTALDLARGMEREATPRDLLNWRFQQMLYRAYYDAYTRRRLLHDREIERRALDCLREAERVGSLDSSGLASSILQAGAVETVAPDWRIRVFQLAEALYQSIRMQLSVPRYKAIGRDRGATLDNIDLPLNNRSWLDTRLAEVRAISAEPDRLKAIERVLNWTNPGSGGFYDDLGDPSNEPHLVRHTSYLEDPGFLRNPLTGFARSPWNLTGWRLSWINDAESMFDVPLEMDYPNLDPAAEYRVRVVYGGETTTGKRIRLQANGIEIHPFIPIENLTALREFDIPRSATAQGKLRLTWTKPAGMAGSGRGCQVAEVWLIRKGSGL